MVDRTLLEQAMKLSDSERLELADALRESIAYRDPELNDEARAVLADAEQDVSNNPAHERAWYRARREPFPHLA